MTPSTTGTEEPRRVTATLRVTIKPGDYRSMTVGFDLDGEVEPGETPEQAMDRLRRTISDRIENAIREELPKYFG